MQAVGQACRKAYRQAVFNIASFEPAVGRLQKLVTVKVGRYRDNF